MQSFYQRSLPGGLVAFSSDEGRSLFREALAEGHLEGFFAVAEQFHTQADPAFCGLGSLVVVLNALAIDPGRLWKGPWRWFSEELLDCCLPLEHVREHGLTMDELACLARCNGAEPRARRAASSSVDELRADVALAARTARAPVMVASYERKRLGQTGSGHFSPIGGYHAGRDLVLLLDVARFKYPPHWVPLAHLFDAMSTVDPASGSSRGWISFQARATRRPALFMLSGEVHVGELLAATRAHVAEALASAPRDDAALALERFSRAVDDLVAVIEPRALEDEGRELQARLLDELRSTEVHAALRVALPAHAPARADVVAALALALPEEVWAPLKQPARDEVLALLARARGVGGVADETDTMREQLTALLRMATCRTT